MSKSATLWNKTRTRFWPDWVQYENLVMPHPLAFPYLESTLASPSSGAQLLSFEGRLNALHTLDLDKNESLVLQVHGNAADCKGTVEAHTRGCRFCSS
jgi:hypothetical protein